MTNSLVTTELTNDTIDPHGQYKKILWHGAYLDGKLTIVFCEKCNKDYPSDIPNTVIVDFALVGVDTTFVGSAAVGPEHEDMDKLIDIITVEYKKYIMDTRKEQSCQLH